MRYLSVCSGIEAASVAWQPLGWEPVAFSEIDKAASRLLTHKYPSTPNWGDMSKFKEWPDATVDVLCGGTPCQSFSVAGLRKGLADPRGNLMLTFGAIAGRYRPRWLVWENVPGVLSSNGGRDFGAFLGMLGELGYGFAYRVLDAQHVRTRRFPRAVPQRRRRVFVVGYLGDWRRAAAVLFDRESLSGHPAPRRKEGQGFAHGVAPSLTGSGRGVERCGESRGQDPVIACADTAPTLNAHFGDKLGLENQHINGGGACLSPPVSHCLNAGGMGRIDYESETFIPMTGGGFDVAHALRGEGFDASEDGTGRGTPIVPVAGALCRDTFTDGAGVKQDGSAYTLEARPVPQAVAFKIAGDGAAYHEGDVTAPMTTGTDRSGNVVAEPFTIMERGREGGSSLESRQDGTANAILTPNGGRGGMGVGAIALPWAVRRLTPRECERLQGFPDDYTLLSGAAKPQADGPRYKQLGNSWAINCIDWIGERIAEVDRWK